MKIAVLGDGVEGKSVRGYFEGLGDEVVVFDEKDGLTSFAELDFSGFDWVFRSPSVSPEKIRNGRVTSATRWFFDKCPCEIIGVTATKGKGTICSMVKGILERGRRVWLVGNIGVGALDVLGQVEAGDVVVYEMSSFQLWDLTRSPRVAVVGRIEPDHLNIHVDMDDYVRAKARIVAFAGAGDKTVYYAGNELSRRIGEESGAREKLAYPAEAGAHVRDGWFYFGAERICETAELHLPGVHNVENALAAISVCWGMTSVAEMRAGLAEFVGLPHRLEKIREVGGVTYYDDNYSSATPATEVAVGAFAGPVILIAGGFDKGIDYREFVAFLNGQENLKKVVLMGQVAGRMSEGLTREFEIVPNLPTAVRVAAAAAESGDVVVMSPGAASFDMFANFSERAREYVRLVAEL